MQFDVTGFSAVQSSILSTAPTIQGKRTKVALDLEPMGNLLLCLMVRRKLKMKEFAAQNCINHQPNTLEDLSVGDTVNKTDVFRPASSKIPKSNTETNSGADQAVLSTSLAPTS